MKLVTLYIFSKSRLHSYLNMHLFVKRERERERAGVHRNIGNISVLNHEQKYLPVRYATICVCVCVCLMRDFSFNGRIPSSKRRNNCESIRYVPKLFS